MVPLLLGLGVDELSAGAARVGELRAQIRSLSLETCLTAAHTALEGAAAGTAHGLAIT
jgi:phosphoenolpyruvate-protein kinase (PTS system EI component)